MNLNNDKCNILVYIIDQILVAVHHSLFGGIGCPALATTLLL